MGPDFVAGAGATSAESTPMFRACMRSLFLAMSASRSRSKSVRPSSRGSGLDAGGVAPDALPSAAGGVPTEAAPEARRPPRVARAVAGDASALTSGLPSLTSATETFVALDFLVRFFAPALASSSTPSAASTAARFSSSRSASPRISETAKSSTASRIGRNASPMPFTP